MWTSGKYCYLGGKSLGTRPKGQGMFWGGKVRTCEEYQRGVCLCQHVSIGNNAIPMIF